MENELCLYGGGVKGVVHIGAIRVLENVKIKFDYIGGSFLGSIVEKLNILIVYML